jgi:epsilon-lactone hydrolase
MSQKQREMADQTFRDSPFDPAGDVLAQRPLLEKMLTAEPPPEDVIVTPGTLGDSPALFLEIADQETTDRRVRLRRPAACLVLPPRLP